MDSSGAGFHCLLGLRLAATLLCASTSVTNGELGGPSRSNMLCSTAGVVVAGCGDSILPFPFTLRRVNRIAHTQSRSDALHPQDFLMVAPNKRRVCPVTPDNTRGRFLFWDGALGSVFPRNRGAPISLSSSQPSSECSPPTSC